MPATVCSWLWAKLPLSHFFFVRAQLWSQHSTLTWKNSEFAKVGQKSVCHLPFLKPVFQTNDRSWGLIPSWMRLGLKAENHSCSMNWNFEKIPSSSMKKWFIGRQRSLVIVLVLLNLLTRDRSTLIPSLFLRWCLRGHRVWRSGKAVTYKACDTIAVGSIPAMPKYLYFLKDIGYWQQTGWIFIPA